MKRGKKGKNNLKKKRKEERQRKFYTTTKFLPSSFFYKFDFIITLCCEAQMTSHLCLMLSTSSQLVIWKVLKYLYLVEEKWKGREDVSKIYWCIVPVPTSNGNTNNSTSQDSKVLKLLLIVKPYKPILDMESFKEFEIHLLSKLSWCLIVHHSGSKLIQCL